MGILKKIQTWIKKNLLVTNSPLAGCETVYQTTESHMINIMKLKLEEEGIHDIILNNMDSSYNNFGKVELYVKQNDVIRAKHIIDKNYE